MYKYILFLLALLPFFGNSTSINDQFKKMVAGNELIIFIQLSEKLEVEVILDKTVRGNGTLLIGKTLLKIKDANADDGKVYINEYLDVFFHDIDSDGVKELIVSGIAKEMDIEGVEIVLTPVLYIYSYSVDENVLVEIFHNSHIDIELTK